MKLTKNIKDTLLECIRTYERPVTKCFAYDSDNNIYVIEGDLITFDEDYLIFKLREYPYENETFKRQEKDEEYKHVPLKEIMNVDINYKLTRVSVYIEGNTIRDSRKQEFYESIGSKLAA